MLNDICLLLLTLQAQTVRETVGHIITQLQLKIVWFAWIYAYGEHVNIADSPPAEHLN